MTQCLKSILALIFLCVFFQASSGYGAADSGVSVNEEKWERAGFSHPSFEVWDENVIYAAPIKEDQAFTHALSLTVVVFRGVGWERGDIRDRMRHFGDLYAKCGIKIEKIDFVEADAPNGWIDVDGQYIGNVVNAAITRSLPVVTRPVFFYVRESRDRNVAYAQPLFHVGAESPLLDTIWITRAQTFWRSRLDPEYSTEAHELGHVLGNFAHDQSGVKNLMAGWANFLSGDIRPDQCDKMKEHKAMRSLLP